MTNSFENVSINRAFDTSVETTPSSYIRLNQSRLLTHSRPSLVSFADLLSKETSMSSPSSSILTVKSKLGMTGDRFLTTSPLGSMKAPMLTPNINHRCDPDSKESPQILQRINTEDAAFCTPENQRPLRTQKLGRKIHYRTYHTDPSKNQPISNLSCDLTEYPSPRRKLCWGGITDRDLKPNQTTSKPIGNKFESTKERRTTIHIPYRQRRSPRLVARDFNHQNNSEMANELSLSSGKDSNYGPISSRLRSSRKKN